MAALQEVMQSLQRMIDNEDVDVQANLPSLRNQVGGERGAGHESGFVHCGSCIGRFGQHLSCVAAWEEIA